MPTLDLILEVILLTVKVAVLTQIIFALPMPLTWLERKIAGHIQVRLGPWRVGPHGILQPFADAIKLLFKEDIVPDKADKILFKIAPLIAMVPAFAVFAAIPLGDTFKIPVIGAEVKLYLSDMNVGALYILAIGGLSVYGMILGGWASNSKYALLGGLRCSAQMISYEIAVSFAVIGVVMLSNSLNLLEIVKSQGGSFLSWNFLYLPVGPVWFAIFLIGSVAEINRIPFDLSEDEGTLSSGYHTEYSGMRFSFFMLAEYVAMVTVSILSVIFFFGGWNAPFAFLSFIPPIAWFMGKVCFFIYFFMWVRFTLPRYRYDQLMKIGWKILIPLSLVNILITGLMLI
ncbi:MAG: NADH-quinone oxidoreductase subunit NuoH [Deltaproteobacteria bacterium]|nr:NADH-quinone oxidoreductase subunit NuoH [Deltaproteobacteria bacterium]